jgi:hypothetical protein
LRSPLIKKIIILLILTHTINLNSARSEISISGSSISEISSTGFLLNYSIRNTFDSDLFSKLQVILPFEKYILQGTIENGVLQEKDFLFSQLDIDLNGDKDVNDLFKVKVVNKKLTIDNKTILSLTRETANYNVMIPFDESGNNNLNLITRSGLPFTLRYYSSSPAEIILGLNATGDIEFKKFDNSLLLIEIVTPDQSTSENLLIDGLKPISGFTNEKDLTGGETLFRFSAVKNISIKEGTAKGDIKISQISKPFLLRLTYYFSISGNLTLMNQKIIKVN